MRTCVGVWLIAVCLGLAGCLHKSPKPGSNGPGPGPAPFPSGGSSGQGAVGFPDIPEPTGDALLAGQVRSDISSSTPSRIIIQVTDLETKTPAAPIDYEVNNPNGVFTITKLKAGRHYKLAVKAQDGDRILTALCFVKPPNPRVLIHLRPDTAAGPLPPGPEVPDKKRRKTEDKPAPDAPPTETKTQGTGGDNKNASSTGGSDGASAHPVPRPGELPGPDPSLIGLNPDRNANNGFIRAPMPPSEATLNIGNNWNRPPASSPIPEPPRRPEAPPPLAPGFEAPSTPSVPTIPTLATGPAEVPSCVMPNDRTIVNFALRDLDGRPWEFRSNRTGRLIVVCFWSVDCRYCPPRLEYLAKLERTYRRYGFQAIGIVGSGVPWTQEQIVRVQAKRAKCNARDMTTLLAGGGGRPCPVHEQFRIDSYPSLVVIEATPRGEGKILWRVPHSLPDPDTALGLYIQRWLNEHPAR